MVAALSRNPLPELGVRKASVWLEAVAKMRHEF